MYKNWYAAHACYVLACLYAMCIAIDEFYNWNKMNNKYLLYKMQSMYLFFPAWICWNQFSHFIHYYCHVHIVFIGIALNCVNDLHVCKYFRSVSFQSNLIILNFQPEILNSILKSSMEKFDEMKIILKRNMTRARILKT